MSVGNPIRCAECGVLHGNHQPSCGRQRTTGEQLYQRMQARIDELMTDIHPHERHKHTGKLIHAFCELLHEMAQPSLWREFDDAMYAHGYHRRGTNGDSRND